MSFTAGQIKAAARGRWDVVFSVLAPSLKAAMRAGRKQHVSCPKHGGTDGFRLYPDWLESGGCICNTCGSRSDGFATLQWLNDWDFPTTVEKENPTDVTSPSGAATASSPMLTITDDPVP